MTRKEREANSDRGTHCRIPASLRKVYRAADKFPLDIQRSKTFLVCCTRN